MKRFYFSNFSTDLTLSLACSKLVSNNYYIPHRHHLTVAPSRPLPSPLFNLILVLRNGNCRAKPNQQGFLFGPGCSVAEEASCRGPAPTMSLFRFRGRSALDEAPSKPATIESQPASWLGSDQTPSSLGKGRPSEGLGGDSGPKEAATLAHPSSAAATLSMLDSLRGCRARPRSSTSSAKLN